MNGISAKYRWLSAGAIGALALAVTMHWQISVAQPKATQDSAGQNNDEALIRKSSQDFIDAFEKGNAKAIAAMWTANGEYINEGGEKLQGREQIEKAFVEFFKNDSGATMEIKINSIRFVSENAAVEEGELKVMKKEEKFPSATRYSVLHVKENGKWRMAIVREWEGVVIHSRLKDLEWLIGHWSAVTKEKVMHLSYHWDKNKVFIHGEFSVKEDGKVVASGMQIIGRDPVDDVVRSWIFGSDGGYGHGVWLKDGQRWTIESVSKLADGLTASSTNIITKLSDNAFVFQSTNRVVGGEEISDTIPTKVNRVNKTQ